MTTVSQYPIYNLLDFWICVGLLIYFAGNFFFLLYSTSDSKNNIRNEMQLIYSIVTISKNLILGLSFFANDGSSGEKDEKIHFPKDLNFDTFTPTNIH